MEKTSQQVASALDMDHLSGASSQATIDDDLDLSIDRDGEVWEEWIEDEDFMPASILPQPSLVTVPSWEESAMRRQLHPIEVKPTSPRAPAESVNSSAQWNEFAPEHVGIIAHPQSQIGDLVAPKSHHSNNSDRLNRLLTDLDI